MRFWLGTALLIGAALVPVQGATLFTDDFSADGSGLGKTTLVNWNVLNGSNVDVANFAASCGPSPAQCIDTQGTGGNPSGDIETKSTFALAPGFSYDFHFTMVNSGGTNSFLVTIGNFSQTINTTTSPNGTYDLVFTSTSVPAATIRITDQGPPDNVGVFLGHISLTSTATAVPEPGTIALTGLAAGLLLVIRRRKTARG
jgi:PEP-CTERM motif